jgi:hypothetical protein
LEICDGLAKEHPKLASVQRGRAMALLALNRNQGRVMRHPNQLRC